MATKKDKKLNPKQELFVIHYIETLNATESYKRAYGTTKQRTAEVQGSRLLRNSEVQKTIDERMKEVMSEKIASAEEVLVYLTSVMRGEVDDEDLTLNNKMKSAELLGKRWKLFTDKVEVDGNMDIEINLGFDEDEE